MYVNYNQHGQRIGTNSRTPVVKEVKGVQVKVDGTISQRAFDQMNARKLMSHTVTGQFDLLYCISEEAAAEVAAIISENPNYSRNGG